MFITFSVQNKGFLNDSFIETPSRDDENDENDEIENNPNAMNAQIGESYNGDRKLSAISEGSESGGSNGGKRDSSRQLLFEQIPAKHENGTRLVKPERPRIFDTPPLFQRTQPSRVDVMPTKTNSFEDKSINSLSDAVEALSIKRTASETNTSNNFDCKSMLNNNRSINQEKLCTELSTPKMYGKQLLSVHNPPSAVHVLEPIKINANQKINSATDAKDPNDETPYKTLEMPPPVTMRRLQSNASHRSLMMSSGQPKKCRTALENEFRSQKVLFTTPSAVSRPTIQMMSNINVLDDSLQCYKSSPLANLPSKDERSVSKLVEQSQTLTSNYALRPADKVDGMNETAECQPLKPIANDQSRENDDGKKVLHINGKDFIIHQRIGSGGSSSVFLAERKDTKLECALKVNNGFVL